MTRSGFVHGFGPASVVEWKPPLGQGPGEEVAKPKRFMLIWHWRDWYFWPRPGYERLRPWRKTKVAVVVGEIVYNLEDVLMEPSGLSLKKMGLRATHGLDCPAGGQHHVLEPEVRIAAVSGGGMPVCLKCKSPIELEPVSRPQG